MERQNQPDSEIKEMPKSAFNLFAAAALTVATSLSANAQTVTAHITLPTANTGAIAANPVTNRIYVVSNSGSASVDDTISVIDGKSDSIVANIAVPVGAYYPAVDSLTNRVYVASCNSFVNPSPCFVTVIDGKKNTVITTIPVTTVLNGFLAGITVNPVTSTVYVSDNTNGDIAVIDGCTNTLTGTISLAAGSAPWGLTVNPFNNELYVTLGTSQIDVINTQTENVVEASTGDGTVDFNVAADLLTGHVFVTSTKSGPSTTAVLDQSGTLLAQVSVGQAAYGVDVDPVTNLAFVADTNDNNTSVIDGRSNTLKTTVTGTGASFLSVNPVTEKVYAAGNGAVTVFTE
jgi:YVTN family beta-propeller protein